MQRGKGGVRRGREVCKGCEDTLHPPSLPPARFLMLLLFVSLPPSSPCPFPPAPPRHDPVSQAPRPPPPATPELHTVGSALRIRAAPPPVPA